MGKLTGKEIKQRAIAFLDQEPKGLRYMQLVKMVHDSAPETPINTVHGAVHSLLGTGSIHRPSKGLWVLEKYAQCSDETAEAEAAKAGLDEQEPVEISQKGKKIRLYEHQFYEPFADWLKNDAEEVVQTMVVGGSVFKNKWGTPDVIGVYKTQKSDVVAFPIEIVAAEIKIDPFQSITAFGQACAYRLFSHKSYLVMPSSLTGEDRDRLEALCIIFGIGLVIFDLVPDAPQFDIQVRAQGFEPDRFFTNEFARKIQQYSLSDFNRLF